MIKRYALYAGFASLVLPALPVLAQNTPDDRPAYTIKEDLPAVGTKLKKNIVTSSLPLNKTYSELTPEQQQVLKSRYETMGNNDEPPYPRYGMGPVLKTIHALQERLPVKGHLTILVDVDSNGKGVAVSIMQTPDMDFARYVASLMLSQDFKPALCGGTPCKQQFVLDVDLSLNL